jgi:hypothetical protein
MFEGYKVVVVCPAGRRHLADVMRRYVERERPLVDEMHWWLNTDNRDDIDYFRRLVAAGNGFYQALGPIGTCWFRRRHMQISRFFRFAIEPDTIYVRVDDDIMWMVDCCIEALLAHRLLYPDAYLVYGNIVNSSRFMHLHQKQGAFDPGFEVAYEINHPTNRRSTAAAITAHLALLDTAEALEQGGDREVLLRPWTAFGRHVFAPGEYNDVNMISWFGHDFAAWNGICPGGVHEERWICLTMPCKHGGRIHEACGDALCAHHSSVVQWHGVFMRGEIYERYARLAPASEFDVPCDPGAVSLPAVDPVS